MKTKFYHAITLAVAIPAASQGALVSHYTLDDTSNGIAVDSVSGNNATWQNGTNTNLGNVVGQIGGAADLTDAGGNNYFQMNLPQLVGANGLTISAWVNNDSNNGYTGVFMTRDFNGATNNSWGIALEPDPDGWHFDSRFNGPGIDSANGSVPIDGNWKHLVLVWDGVAGTATQYINGVETATGASISGTIAGPSSGPWYIGYDNCCGGGRDFDGKLDDIMVWDNALSALEVNGVYQAGLVPEPSTSLLGLLGGLFLFRRRR